jgi:hypothetical protein
MKRKYGDRAGWARIAERAFTVAQIDLPAFSGVAALYTMLRVREPLYKPVAGELTLIADDGFRWLQLYSADAQRQTYTVTAAFNPENIVAQWYIDVCAGHGVNHTGVPWHDDLYLDIVVSERGALAVIDAADLESAVEMEALSLPAYHLAWREAHRLAPLARSRLLPEMRFAAEALGAMRALESGQAVAGYTRITHAKGIESGI